MRKILYGIKIVFDSSGPIKHGGMLRVGERVNRLFAVRKETYYWSIDHLPTGFSAGSCWRLKKNAIAVARMLFRSGHLDETNVDALALGDVSAEYWRLYREDQAS